MRSIFSGHTNSVMGFSYRLWTLLRVFCFVAISMAPLSPVRTVVFFIFLVIAPVAAHFVAISAAMHRLASCKVLATLLFEGMAEPRTTNFMSTLDRMEVDRMRICAYTHVHTDIHAYTHARTRASTHARTQTHTARTRSRTHALAHTHTHRNLLSRSSRCLGSWPQVRSGLHAAPCRALGAGTQG